MLRAHVNIECEPGNANNRAWMRVGLIMKIRTRILGLAWHKHYWQRVRNAFVTRIIM